MKDIFDRFMDRHVDNPLIVWPFYLIIILACPIFFLMAWGEGAIGKENGR